MINLIGVFAVLNTDNVYDVVEFEAKENSPVSNSEPVSPLRVIDEFFHIAGSFATKSRQGFENVEGFVLLNAPRFNEDPTR